MRENSVRSNFGGERDQLSEKKTDHRVMEEKIIIKSYICDKCGASAFNSMRELSLHRKNNHESTRFTYESCQWKHQVIEILNNTKNLSMKVSNILVIFVNINQHGRVHLNNTKNQQAGAELGQAQPNWNWGWD